MTVLITAIGSMSADSVIKSIRDANPSWVIIGVDINPAKWLYLSKKVDYFYHVPYFYHPEYIPEIKKLCEKHKVNFILPLTDPEIDIFSEKRGELGKFTTSLTLPSNEDITQIRNKLSIWKKFSKHIDIKVIETFQFSEIKTQKLIFPLIAKPQKGRSSEGLRHISDERGLNDLNEDYVIQRFIEGNIITVDFVRDQQGTVVSLPRKELIRTANGAGLSVKIFQDPKIHDLITKVAEDLNIVGCMNIEFIEKDGNYYLMDINPRFSAGIGFSYKAGYNFVLNHIRVNQGKPILSIGEIKDIIMAKHFKEYILD